MPQHKLKLITPSKQERSDLHSRIVSRELGIPFNLSVHGPLVENAKKGRFHQSNSAIVLYCTAYPPRALHPKEQAPFGYVSAGDSSLMAFGVYRRDDNKNFGCIIPICAEVSDIISLSRKLMDMHLDGVYVRFLSVDDYRHLIAPGSDFLPIKESPWHPHAPEEDETLSNSRMPLSAIFDKSLGRFKDRYLRQTYQRGLNFLRRLSFHYHLEPWSLDVPVQPFDIVSAHFSDIEKRGKAIGSSVSDYVGITSPGFLSSSSVTTYMGYLNDLPISFYVCESLGEGITAAYAGMTLKLWEERGRLSRFLTHRKSKFNQFKCVKELSKLKKNDRLGWTALPTYAFAELFMQAVNDGTDTLYLGGSEIPSLNSWKKEMGAQPDPTYWAVMLK